MLLDYENYLMLLPIVVAFYGLLFLLLKSRISGFLDPLNISIIYVSFGVVGLGNYVYKFNTDAQVFYLTLLWISAFVAGLNLFLYINTNKNAGVLSFCIKDKSSYSVAMMWTIRLIYALYFLTILKSGILDGDLSTAVDERFKVFQDSKVLFYIFNSVSMLPAVAIFMCFGKLNFFRFFLKVVPFWLVQLLTFSKTGFVFPILQYAIYYSLIVTSSPGGVKSNIIKYLMAGLVASAFIMIVFYVVAEFFSSGAGGEMAISLLLSRLFTSYDALTMYSTLTYASEPNASIFQWYFSPYLKLIGFFTQYYNSANYYLAVNYFGYSSDYAGMLPNNNNVLEVCLGFPVISRPLLIIVFACCYAFLYRLSFIISTRCSFFLVPFGFIYSTPLGFLVDGQGWFIALTTSFVVLLIHLLLFAVVSNFRLFGLRRYGQ